jgi:hypothetical protein
LGQAHAYSGGSDFALTFAQLKFGGEGLEPKPEGLAFVQRS